MQLCGDAHLSNFGAFAAPDRRLVFSVNDFDETPPGTRSRSRAISAGAIASTGALASFAEAYADQNERDYDALRAAVASGRIVAEVGL